MQFVSKYKEHRIVMQPACHQIVGINKVLMAGEDIQFMNFVFDTEDKGKIDFLKNHKEFGINIHLAPSKKDKEDAVLKMADDIKKKRAPKKEETKKEEIKEAFNCPHCDFVAASAVGLKSHIRAKHPNEK